MKSPVLYLLEVLFCSGLLMAFYRLLLQRKVSFALCRRYLVAAVVLSAVIPALNIPLYPARTVVYPLPLITATEDAVPAGEVFAEEFAPAPAQPVAVPAIDWNALTQKAIWAVYALAAAVLLAFFAVRFLAVRRLRRHTRLTDCGRYTLAEHPSIASPFSFLRTVFLGDGYEGRRREIVVCHEVSHVLHCHSAERIVVEIMRCLFWFNPFVWMAARWLQEVQEWEADHDVLEAGYDLTEYRTVIFRQLFGYNPDIACGLNHSLTKNRFAMMTQFKESRFALVRFGAAIPIVAGMMMLCSFTTRTPDPGSQQPATASAPAASVIPGLETLKPIPIHMMMASYDAVGGKFESLDYLPVDDSKYKYVNGTVTDLKGKDINWWAQKHYYVQSKNPVFVIDGVKMNKDEYVAYKEAQRKEKGNKYVSSERTETIYAGPEVGKLLGDPTVDALVISYLGEATAGNLSLTGSYEKQNQYTATYEGKRPNLLDAVINGTITSEGPTADDTYTVIGKLEVVFKSLPGWKISCDTLIGYPKRVECRGDALLKDGKGNTFVGQCFEFNMSPSGKLEWQASKFKGMAVAETATIHLSADGIIFNGKRITKEQLLLMVGEWRESIPADKRSDAVITLKADNQTPMGVVTDAKDQLRKAGQLRVNYATANSPQAIVRTLPPPADIKTVNGVQVIPSKDVAIKARNLFVVAVNGSGKILAGQRGKEQIVPADKLAAMVETFVANNSDSPALSEKQTKEFTLPDGRTISYPVSNGVVALMIARDTPYQTFIDAQRQIAAGFEQIRGAVAQKWFGKAFAALDQAQRNLVVQAIPLNISEAEPRSL